MRKIINYFRSLFCKHDFALIVNNDIVYEGATVGEIKIYMCKKCGYTKKIKVCGTDIIGG